MEVMMMLIEKYSWNVSEDGFYKNEDGETPFD